MGSQVVSVHVAEIQRRITQISSPDALAAFNKASRWIEGRGSFIFQLSGSVLLTSSSASIIDGPGTNFSQADLPLDFDPKKAILVANTSGLPIIPVPINRLWESFGLNNPDDQGFTTYRITAKNILGEYMILLRPAQSSNVQVGIRYHSKPYTYGLGDTTRLPEELELLAIDLAEAEERRIYSVGDQWVKTRDDIRAVIDKTLDGYRSISEEGMPMEEAVAAVQEQTKLGRA